MPECDVDLTIRTEGGELLTYSCALRHAPASPVHHFDIGPCSGWEVVTLTDPAPDCSFSFSCEWA